jgi:hypothetical protein
VVNPPPTVVLTSPLAGSTVNGVTTITAAGAVDPSQDDFPRNLQLVVDGVVTATSLCTAGGLTCAGSFAWDTAGLVGSHNLQVRFNTLHNSVITVVSAVIVAPRLSAIRLSGVAAVHVGGSGSVRGYLVSPNGGLPIAGAPLTVTFTPANAAPVTVPVKTDASGVFVATYPLPVTAKIAVTVVAPPEYGSSTATGVIPVMTPITCAVPAKAKHGKVTKIVCSSPLLPNGTVVTLRDIDKGTHVVATGKVKNGKVHFAVTFAKKRKYRLDLWATTGSSKLYSPTTSKTYRILVT